MPRSRGNSACTAWAMTEVVNALRREVQISAGGKQLPGTLTVPDGAEAIVLFAHGSGSSRRSPRNRLVADAIVGAGFGTLLFDLLTSDEEEEDVHTGHLRYDIGLLASRLADATVFLGSAAETSALRAGYFGASTGAAAALVAAASLGAKVGAVVSRGGRPDLAGDALPKVVAPTLLIVGGMDDVVVGLNEEALAQLRCAKTLQILQGAAHLFEEPGALDQVAAHAIRWFTRYLQAK